MDETTYITKYSTFFLTLYSCVLSLDHFLLPAIMTVLHPQTSNIGIEIGAVVWFCFSNLVNHLLVHIYRQNCFPMQSYTGDVVPPSQAHIRSPNTVCYFQGPSSLKCLVASSSYLWQSHLYCFKSV